MRCDDCLCTYESCACKIQGNTCAYEKSVDKLDQADIITAKSYLQDEIAKHPTCNEPHILMTILENVKKKCPKGHNTENTCYEMCGYRENGFCTLNDRF